MTNEAKAAMTLDATCPPDVALARRWAGFYRQRGWNALPSATDSKRPLVRYAQWWDKPMPGDLFDRFETTNIQLMLGRCWRLLVLDLDGPEARERFRGMVVASGKHLPRTWATNSGGNGVHLWFRVESSSPPLPKAVLWKGDGSHSAIERLCDRSLIMAPPSIHPKTGRRYRFASKGESPARLPFPAECPRWILELKPREVTPGSGSVPLRPVPAPLLLPRPAARYRPSDVLDSIGDKVGLAASWGLRLATRRPNDSGWCYCHAIGREDRTPSATISATTGRYWEPGAGAIGFFDLAVRLGVYPTWQDAANDLGRRFRAREAS